MEKITFKGRYNEVTENVYNIKDFPIIGNYPVVKKRVRGKEGVKYYNIASAFDIETTSIKKDPLGDSFGFMYHWQFCLKDKVVFGRTWDEFIDLLDRLVYELELNENRYLVIFSHNLAFEWQFLNQFIYERFTDNIDAFFTAKRRPLTVRLPDKGIEFRCSWKLSNMSLFKYVENCFSNYLKLSGEAYNYSKLRTPNTLMTEYEKAYCYCDVRGLCDAVTKEFEHGFNIATLPLTSTGFVRKDTLKAFQQYDKYVNKGKCNQEWQELFDKMPHKPDKKYSNFNFAMREMNCSYELYKAEKNASKGGDTHANIMKSAEKLYNVYSFDRKSSYPAVQLTYKYPDGHWIKRNFNREQLFQRLKRDDIAAIFTVYLRNIRLKPGFRCPYLSLYKCKGVKGSRLDNGRIYQADCLYLTVTEVDWEIIKRQYDFDLVEISDVFTTFKTYLPVPLRAVNMKYFYAKCELDGVDDYLYMKSKNKLNAIFGMSFTDIVHDIIDYDMDMRRWERDKPDPEEALFKYYNSYSSCLNYDTGIYTTAYARKELHEAIEACGDAYIYSDTDSVKWATDDPAEYARIMAWFENKNEELSKVAYDCGAYYKMPDGKEIVLGVWENESKDGGALYEEFKTFGAKKYAYKYTPANKGGKFAITVAGLSKQKGAEYIGSVDNFNLLMRIPEEYSGRMISVWQDDPIHNITINGETFETASSCATINTTFTLNQSLDWLDLLNNLLILQ